MTRAHSAGPASTLFLGVDAGNSKTAALVSTATGQVVGAGRSACGDIYGAPTPEAAVAEVLAAVREALAQAGADLAVVKAAAFRLAGIDWPEDRTYWDQALTRHCPGTLTRRTILNDGYAAIRCGDPGGVGISVTGGTAAAIAARGPDGKLWDMGWWSQHAMGATGLANQAFRAVLLAELELGPPTALTEALLTHYGKPTVAALNHWLTRREGHATGQERNSCARVVTAVAAAGDPVAVEIIRAQGARFAQYAGVAARRTGLTRADRPVSVVLAGSVLMAEDSPVAEALLAELPAHVPGAVPLRGSLPPVAGALLDALAEGGVPLHEREVADAVSARVTATMPPREFLAT
ncbi:BadF/BadG/BcrA/BcrD ATPase family protein [Streptomyces sparsogenes]|uniref:BadF/BadG/BcrA/BcrD type ATPase n=1 Tax=Streptomyces sparsogenes DSM 40356 TaxID=1331668 RepID=A0A1R1SER1_9ACTN|nr:BadF/BadG/BcrA/BcrD ATPase family protein [Streptomyces sparsogenes]OMI36499.1 BadF/BadG/BcrA/BcrD type ATPase [Streptomyces sparsogenes DSM 40356]